ncbi:MAG: carbohydrate ABC transporter permease [Defluviitaleaceae bacterium]|nr:carbohydrate ABC transporter permease [Defluviitaleaceae bacterium]
MFSRVRNRINYRSTQGTIAIFLLITFIGMFMGFPLILSFSMAFKPVEEFFIFPPRIFVANPTFGNFQELFSFTGSLRIPIIRYFTNSVYLTLMTSLISVTACSLAAYPFAKKNFIGKKVLWRLVILALLFTGGVLQIPVFIIYANLGLVDNYWGIVIPALCRPLYLFLMRQFMLQIPDSFIEAAKIDGANEMNVFTKIILPSVKPALMTVAVLVFIEFWNMQGDTIYTEAKRTLPAAVSQIGTTGAISILGVVAASQLLLLLPPIVLFIINQHTMLQTMAHSGIKE